MFENYEPNQYYKDIETTFCQLGKLDKYGIDHTEEVVTGLEQGTTFPTKIGTTICNALIDTGATRCCISEEYYRKLQLTKIHLLQNVNVRPATGSNLAPIGLGNCTFVLGDITFNCDFIMCKYLTRPPILERDFLIQNHISVRYSDNGKSILDHKQQELVASVCVETKPQLSLANFMTLPGRTLAVVHINNNLSPEQSGQLYGIEPNYLLTNEYPNLCIIPMIHNVDIHKTEDLPLVVINFSTDSVYLSKGEITGFMQSQSLDISEITTETSTGPSPILLEEDNDIRGTQRTKKKITLAYTEKKFITSPTDIGVHRKVDLQDADITEEQQNAFKELCDEYKDIFSADSNNIGRNSFNRNGN